MRYILLFLMFLAPPALACGPDTNCPVGDRFYRIDMPKGHDGKTPVGALVWSHGYGGSAQGVMRNRSLRRMVSNAGLALIALQGRNGAWSLPNGPGSLNSTGAAEFAYVDRTLADASARHPIDPDRVIAGGFSLGGMMVWNLACSHPEQFAGFIPMSGTYWQKPPKSCVRPASSIVHIHGKSDTTVPLNGRRIGQTKQGRVQDALAQYKVFGGFGPAQQSRAGDLTCQTGRNNAKDILEFCLFPGGHSFRTEHLRYGIEQLKAAGQI